MKPLVRFDAELGRFVLDTTQVEYWPGTKIKKSKDNDFNWRGKPSKVKVDSHLVKPDLANKEPVRVYAKARRG